MKTRAKVLDVLDQEQRQRQRGIKQSLDARENQRKSGKKNLRSDRPTKTHF